MKSKILAQRLAGCCLRVSCRGHQLQTHRCQKGRREAASVSRYLPVPKRANSHSDWTCSSVPFHPGVCEWDIALRKTDMCISDLTCACSQPRRQAIYHSPALQSFVALSRVEYRKDGSHAQASSSGIKGARHDACLMGECSLPKVKIAASLVQEQRHSGDIKGLRHGLQF